MLKDKIVSYFRSGEKQHEQFKIAVDFEHIVVSKKDLKAVPFKGLQGVESLLMELTQKGWQEIKENEHVVGLKKNRTNITLGGGCQIILSVKKSLSIKEIDQVYLNFLRD